MLMRVAVITLLAFWLVKRGARVVHGLGNVYFISSPRFRSVMGRVCPPGEGRHVTIERQSFQYVQAFKIVLRSHPKAFFQHQIQHCRQELLLQFHRYKCIINEGKRAPIQLASCEAIISDPTSIPWRIFHILHDGRTVKVRTIS